MTTSASMLAKLRLGEKISTLLDKVFPRPVTVWDHLRQNLIIGMFVVVVVTLFQGSDFIRNSRENSLDWLLRMHRGIQVMEGKEFRPFVYYDIDDRSHEAWGEPFAVPRSKLAKLVAAALRQQPAVLVVDVELLHKTDDDGELLEILRRHATGSGATHVILLKGFKWKEDAERGDYLVARDSFFENKIPPSQNLTWASPLFERDRDGQIRRWKFWQQACAPTGGTLLVPSVQLATFAVIIGNGALPKLMQALSAATPASCHDEPVLPQDGMNIGKHHYAAGTDHFGQRILFSFPWKLAAEETRPEVSFGDRRVRQLSIIPAHIVTEGGITPSLPAGHIAVIGASHQDARDTHMTPLGLMPGSLILINAMNSLIQYGQLTTPPIWLQLITAAAMLIGVSFIFMKFPSMMGALVSLVMVLILLVPMSIYLFRYGVWLDFALPLTAVKGFQLVMEYHRKHMEKRGIRK